ncbi:MAG: DNA polymerase III subunit alpha [Acidobacteria bacterium]|nr:DNA polymerase III subunit alpha [Acidobacteriota bacterium]
MSRPFVHLHVHSDFSLLDGACPVHKIVDKAAALGMEALALTDHGNLFGAVQFYQETKKRKIKPIIGCEVYVAQGSRHNKTSQTEKRFHLILLVRDDEGYHNLCRLVSLSYTEGFYYKPRVDWELLEQHAGGLIALSACIQGEVPVLLEQGDEAGAEAVARRYEDLFGKGNFYLEIQDHGLPEQKSVNPKLIALSRRTGIPLVATNDCHYLEGDDHLAQDVLVCIQTGKLLNEEKRMQFNSREFFFKTAEEMEALFPDVPEALDNTVSVAARCNFDFDLTSQHYPRFEIPAGSTLDDYFEQKTREGFAARREVILALQASGELRYPPEEYDRRLDYEIGVIKKLNYAGYFLIVWDFIRHARERHIPVGPGRGSAAGSLVAYALRITDLDPLQYDLLFERFLNPERVSPPDIDIDFCNRRREEVIRYVTEKYGKDCVCQIITFGTMRAKAVVRDVGRVLGMPYVEVDKIAKLIPQELNITLEKALSVEPRLTDAMRDNPQVRQLVEIARKLEGFSRHSSVHAAGVVIAPRPLREIVPLYMGSDGVVTTQYNMKDVEKLGLLKMDFLGLITLTVIDDALKLIQETRGRGVDIDRIPLDDAETYKVFADGRTAGIFQFESAGMRNYLKSLKPSRFEDIIVMNALYRPGPIKGGMITDFIARKHGTSRVEYPIPELEPILKPTYGVLVYQEQVMQIAVRLAGLSMGGADTLRKAMGKKDMAIMDRMAPQFVEGCVSRGVDRKKASDLFEQMRQFGEYGFNKSHSAAYAWLAYQTAWLKAHYPAEFMAALLTSEQSNTSKVVQYIAECKAMGIPILPPSINHSRLDFLPTDKGIWFGLGAVKNVGDAAIEAILGARAKGGPFKSFTDFCCRVELKHLNARVLESLNKAGVFDELGYRRSQVAEIYPRTVEFAQKCQRDKAIGQGSLFSLLGEAETADTGAETENLPDLPEWDPRVILQHEKEILGFYISGHPLDEHAGILGVSTDTFVGDLAERDPGGTVRIGGILSSLATKKTMKGETMANGLLEDKTGTIRCIVYPRTWREYEGLLLPDTPLLVTGTIQQEGEKDPEIVVNEVKPLAECRETTVSAVRLELELERLTPDRAQALTELLLERKGECAVEIVLSKRDVGVATLDTNGFLRVKWSAELKSIIEEIAYPGAVRPIR